MTRQTIAALAAALSLSLLLPRPAVAAPDEAADREAAVKALNAGAAMVDAKDAKGLAATYADDGVLTVLTRDKDTGAIKTETKRARAEIEEAYRDFFKGDGAFHARNTVEYVRRAGPDLLLIAGFFEPDTQAADPLKLPFVQLRQKQGDAWKIVSLQFFFFLEK